MAFSMFLAGCVPPGPEPAVTDVGRKPESWDGSNDPRRFAADMEVRWEVLRGQDYRTGASEIVPWVDTYWPMRRDGYNQRWQGRGHLSPVELYDQAFNGWTPPEGFMDLRPFSSPGSDFDEEYYEALGPAASWAHRGGNLRVMNGLDDDDDGEVDNGWDGLEGWFGHCHAWAPAAMSVAEPEQAVEINGVTFEVADVKAIVEASFEVAGSVFLGGRCDLEDVERDEHGRITARECRDTNPGSFHVVTLNVMGDAGRSFVIDATYGYEVWNQPVRDYTIELQEEVSEARALELLGRTDVEAYPYNARAEGFVHVRMNLRYVVEGSASTQPYADRIDSYTRTARYEYLLELDGEGDIIGGEWIDDNPHPDFLWAPTGNGSVREGSWGRVLIDIDDVRELLDLSTATEPPPAGEEHVYESAPSLAIPDEDHMGVTDTIEVPELIDVEGVRVTVDITHTYRGDLRLELSHGGRTATLFANEGGSADDLRRTFTAADWNGADSAGDWTLRVVDAARQDTGTLGSWELVIIGEGGGGDEHVYESAPAVAIPDDDSSGVHDTISVPEAFSIESMHVDVAITHTYRGDLRVELAHDGVTAVLADRQGGGADDLVETFEVAHFDGAAAAGQWTLRVVDGAGADVGTLDSWRLTLVGEGETPPPPPPGGEEHLFESSPAAAIPDDDPAGVTDVLAVGESLIISALRVEVDITHSWRGDLTVQLHRDADTVTLFARDGGSADDLVASFDVTDFDGQDAAGEWTLRVIDGAGADLGTLNDWRLVVTD